MTMLDRMRRHKNWLKWSLFIVVLAFIAFYVPDFIGLDQPGLGGTPAQRLAEVEGRQITVGDFQRVYAAQLNAYRSAYGGNVNEQLLRQMGIDRQIVQQLVDEQAALAEADRLGIEAGDAEVRERILKIPAFNENGVFIGEQRYRALLAAQRPPMSHTEFEDGIRRAIVLEKLQSAVTDWIAVTDAEADADYRRRNEKAKIELVMVPSVSLREGITASDAEVAAHFEKHKEAFRVGEKRKVRFAVVDVAAIRQRVTVPAVDVERYYNTNIDQFSTPAEMRASHILLKTEGKDLAAVRAAAEKVLAEVKAGGDFAALAKKYSEDEASKDRGGDLDFFGRGRMVPAFEEAAFALEPGQVSELVSTEFGFHIIKATDRREGAQRPLDEVREQITEQLKWERAQEQARALAERLGNEVKNPGDLDKAAAANGLEVKESNFFERTEAITGLGPSPEIAAEAFDLEVGEVSEPLPSAQGYVIIGVTDKQDAHLPTLDEAKDKVREAVVSAKATEAARQKAAAVAAALKGNADMAAVAKANGLEVRTSELVARGAAWPDAGLSAAVDQAAFSLPVGTASEPIVTDRGVVVVKVVERSTPTDADVAASRAGVREQLLRERKNRFFSAYMTKAKQRMKIDINREALAQLIRT